MKGNCKCGEVIDEVEYTQFGMCEKCYKRKEELKSLKIKLSKLLTEIQWYIPEDEFYETFPDTLRFIEGYF